MSWEQLLSIAREAKEEAAANAAAPPVSCPRDGEPLKAGPHGGPNCRFCGWTST